MINALCAAVYIAAVVSFIFYGVPEHSPAFNTILGPMLMLSLFVLSAAVMGYLFVLQPVQLYFEGKRAEGVRLFLQTVGCFAAVTLVILLLGLLLPLPPTDF